MTIILRTEGGTGGNTCGTALPKAILIIGYIGHCISDILPWPFH